MFSRVPFVQRRIAYRAQAGFLEPGKRIIDIVDDGLYLAYFEVERFAYGSVRYCTYFFRQFLDLGFRDRQVLGAPVDFLLVLVDVFPDRLKVGVLHLVERRYVPAHVFYIGFVVLDGIDDAAAFGRLKVQFRIVDRFPFLDVLAHRSQYVDIEDVFDQGALVPYRQAQERPVVRNRDGHDVLEKPQVDP